MTMEMFMMACIDYVFPALIALVVVSFLFVNGIRLYADAHENAPAWMFSMLNTLFPNCGWDGVEEEEKEEEE